MKQPEPERIRAFAEELSQIAWFSHCGEKPLPAYPFAAKFCARSTALVKVRGIKWENIRLDAKNQLTEYLCFQKPALYHDGYYNALVSALKQNVTGPLRESMTPAAEARFGKDAKSALTEVHWDVLHILIGAYYAEAFALPLYPELLTVYRSGHLPVGMEPDGTLLVY